MSKRVAFIDVRGGLEDEDELYALQGRVRERSECVRVLTETPLALQIDASKPSATHDRLGTPHGSFFGF